MWVIDNRTPFGSERNWIRDKLGRHHWLVAVRATFEVSDDGRLRRVEEQPPPALAPEYVGSPGNSSLRCDSELLYRKPCTDVIVEAHAHAAGAQPSSRVMVTLRVATLQKTLAVYGDRFYRRGFGGLSLSSPQPFTSRPILYEWAYGGSDLTHPDPRKQGLDERNPVGKGFAPDKSRLVDTLAPAIEYPGGDLETAGPAGFLPIDCAWQPRRAYSGTYDALWEKRKRPLLPDDYDDRYGSSAPADQCLRRSLVGGEMVELLGMTPSGRFFFCLPTLEFCFVTHFGRRAQTHEGRLTTLFLQPELRRVSLLWQSALEVPASDCDYLDSTRVTEKGYVECRAAPRLISSH